jgi:hypothetical protein
MLPEPSTTNRITGVVIAVCTLALAHSIPPAPVPDVPVLGAPPCGVGAPPGLPTLPIPPGIPLPPLPLPAIPLGAGGLPKLRSPPEPSPLQLTSKNANATATDHPDALEVRRFILPPTHTTVPSLH